MFIKSAFHSLRFTAFCTLLACQVGWLIYGWDYCARYEKDPASQWIDDLVARVRKEDPATAERISQVRHGQRPIALATALRAADERANLSGLREFVRQSAGGAAPPQLVLTSLATDPGQFGQTGDRSDFINAHATAIQVFQDSGDNEAATDYARLLTQAGADHSAWLAVRDDPVALVVFNQVKVQSLRDVYSREKDWLRELIPQLIGRPVDQGNDALHLASILQTAKEFAPLPRRAVLEFDLGAAGFVLFLEYGELIRSAVDDFKLPLDETLEIIFANLDVFESKHARDPQSAKQVAKWLFDIHSKQANVWTIARINGLALRLHEKVPAHADNVLRRFGVDDIASLLLSSYEKEIVSATEAVDFFGDLAIHLLVRFEADSRFHAALSKSGIGARAVPFVARFGDGGLDDLKQNTAWLDKYFEADGKPRGPSWWEAVPILGAPAKLFSNWSHGYPNEWSELGWAALDVADGFLLVASFGGAAVVEQTVKEAGKETVKTFAKQEAKQIVKAEAKAIGRDLATKTAKGARLAANKTPRSSMLRRIASSAAHVGGFASNTVIRIGKMVWVIGRPVVVTTKRIATAWKNLPLTARKLIYRALLGVGLFYTIRERTIPVVKRKGAAAVDTFVDKASALLGETLNAILPDFMKTPSVAKRMVCFGIPVAVLLVPMWLCRPRRRKVQYV